MFRKGDDIIIRFFDSAKEQNEDEIADLVIVDPGYGFLCLKVKGDSGLMSGYLDQGVFASDEMVEAAVGFLEELSPKCKGGYIPFHIRRRVEYLYAGGQQSLSFHGSLRGQEDLKSSHVQK